MSGPHPDTVAARAAVALAVRAPSVHNTQPWQWRVGDTSVHLYADEERRLSQADPDGRDEVMSCGAALHHFRVAAKSMGWRTVVHRLPNPAEPAHLAAIEFAAAPPTADDEELARAINRRHTERRRLSAEETSAGELALIMSAATEEGTDISEVNTESQRSILVAAFMRAAEEHRGDPAYRDELARWSGHHAESDGVPARNAVPAGDDPLTREFAVATLTDTGVREMTDGGSLLLVHTGADDRLSWLRAGEAGSAAVLTATMLGLATCPMSEAFELPDTREAVREGLLGGIGYPQLVVRVGRPAAGTSDVPISPRRSLDEVIAPLR
ncbi:Acg family FMN-binding oxidoreductase [Nocardia sp. NPDC003345]